MLPGRPETGQLAGGERRRGRAEAGGAPGGESWTARTQPHNPIRVYPTLVPRRNCASSDNNLFANARSARVVGAGLGGAGRSGALHGQQPMARY